MSLLVISSVATAVGSDSAVVVSQSDRSWTMNIDDEDEEDDNTAANQRRAARAGASDSVDDIADDEDDSGSNGSADQRSNARDGSPLAAEAASSSMGVAADGAYEFRVSVSGMTVPQAKALVSKLRKSTRVTTLGIYGQVVTSEKDHASVMQVLLEEGILYSPHNNITRLSMSSPLGHVQVFQSILSSLRTLILASSVMTVDMAQQVQVGLIRNATIREFTIEFGEEPDSRQIFNTLVDAFAERDMALDKLTISHESSFEDEDDAELGPDLRPSMLECLHRVIQQGKAPLELEIIGCDVVTRDVQVLAAYLAQTDCRLTALAISDTLERLSCVEPLCEALRLNQSLKCLHLDCDQLECQEITLLARGLGHNTTLTALHMCGNRIGDEGIEAFCNEWQLESPLEQLELGFNVFSAVGARILARAVAKHPKMQGMSLIQNDTMGYEGLKVIGEELSTLQLRTLNLSCCVDEDVLAGEATLDALGKRERELARQEAGAALWHGMQSNTCLHELNVSCNLLPPQMESDINFLVQVNQMGRYLLTQGQRLPSAVWCHIFAKCRNPNMIFYFLREQPLLLLWRNEQGRSEGQDEPPTKKRCLDRK